MEKILILITFFSSFNSVTAQPSKSKAINLYGSYIFKDKVQFDDLPRYVKEGFQYGAGLEYFFERNTSLELKYLRQHGCVPLIGVSVEQVGKGNDKSSVSYFLVGVTTYFGGTSKAKVVPFAGAGVGFGSIHFNESESTTKYAWDGKLGLQIKTCSKVSFRLQGTLQAIIGTDIYARSTISGITVPGFITLLQFGISTGLCYQF